MASSVPAAKSGIRAYLASWPGLTGADGVTIRSAPGVGDLPDDTVELGAVTAPQTVEGLAMRSETPTMTCWCQATRTGTDEAAIAAARTRVYQLHALVQAALRADPDANGTIPPPAQAVVGDSNLIEAPAEVQDQGARRAQVRFSITWTSHII